jgi:uncharacterized membrane protein YcaP (DUF421 family)
MNIGVIAFGTLVGLVVFNERLSLLNKIGIALAIVAIIVITISHSVKCFSTIRTKPLPGQPKAFSRPRQ